MAIGSTWHGASRLRSPVRISVRLVDLVSKSAGKLRRAGHVSIPRSSFKGSLL